MPRGYRVRISEADAFAILERTAAAGLRCPKTGEQGMVTQLTSDLARAGKIRIDIYPHNFRVVTILEGPHAGKSTAPPPNSKWRPYLTIDKASPTRPTYTNTRISP